MKDFLEKALRQNVILEETNYLDDKLPLVFQGRYVLYKVTTNGLLWLAIKPKNDIGLIALRRDRTVIEKITNLNCAIFLDNSTFYIKEKLTQEGVPFVIKDKQVYLPFIGILLTNNKERILKPVHLISFLTQKMILIAIYERWNNVLVSEAANKLKVSKMSISRCFDEIEYFNINILSIKGKRRAITISENIKELWDSILPILRNPIIRSYKLQYDIKLDHKAGISALCSYSMLSDNEYPTYAITKKELVSLGINNIPHARFSEEIGCIVQELGYFIDFNDMKSEDPLSVILSISEKDKQDERVILSINQMLEEYVW